MPYCMNCGVKLDDRSDYCPLCQGEIEFPETRKKLPPLYPKHVNVIPFTTINRSPKDWLIVHFSGFLTLLIIILISGIDYAIARKLTWSLYPAISLIYLYLTLSTLLYFKKNPFLMYTLLNILLCLFLFALDRITIENSWFLDYAVYCFIALQLLSISLHFLFKIVKSKLLRTSTIIITTNITLIFINQLTSTTFRWSVIISSIFIPTAIFIAYLDAKIKGLTQTLKH